MSKVEFPKMVYGTEGRQRIVESQEEQDALGGEWRESPGEVADAPQQAEPEAGKAPAAFNESRRGVMDILPPDHTHRDRVEAEARALGIKFKKSDTTETIQRLILEQASA